MNPLKTAIFDEVRKNNTELSSLDDEALNRLVFHHPNGLRLSLRGFVVVKKIFTAYSFEIPDTIKSRHQKNLSTLTYPYFLTQRRLILFSSGDSLMVTLCGGVTEFLEDR